MITFDIKPRAFSSVLERLAKETGKTASDVLRAQARLLAVDLAFRTQPYGKSIATKAKGEVAIRRDLLGGKGRAGVIMALDDSLIDAALESGIYSTGNVRLFVRKDGAIYGTDRTHFVPNALPNQLRALHKQAFRNGRMTTAGSRDRTIGRWRFIERATVRKSAAERYVQGQQKKVGWVKSGWAACARQLGGTRGIPGWVTRHKGQTGLVRDHSQRTQDPSITLTNLVAYSAKVLPDQQIADAVERVKRNMERQLDMILRRKK
jgi:hypothetical protein